MTHLLVRSSAAQILKPEPTLSPGVRGAEPSERGWGRALGCSALNLGEFAARPGLRVNFLFVLTCLSQLVASAEVSPRVQLEFPAELPSLPRVEAGA